MNHRIKFALRVLGVILMLWVIPLLVMFQTWASP